MKLHDKRHFFLYAKGWYKQGNVMRDMKNLQSEYCGIPASKLTDRNVLQILLPLAWETIKTEAHFIDFMDHIVGYAPVYLARKRISRPMAVTVIEACLSRLSLLKVKDGSKVIYNLGKPDPKVMPLKHKEGE